MLHYGVLYKMEDNLVEKKDVIIKDEHTDTIIDHPTTRKFKGFVHKIPGWMIGLFVLCMSQLDSKRK